MRKVVKRSGARSQRRPSVPGQIPCHSDARRKVGPFNVHNRLTWISGVPTKEHTRRRVIKLATPNPLLQRIHVKVTAAAIPINQREERLPAQAITQGYFPICLPCIGRINSNILGTLSLGRNRSILKLRGMPDEEVCHAL